MIKFLAGYDHMGEQWMSAAPPIYTANIGGNGGGRHQHQQSGWYDTDL